MISNMWIFFQGYLVISITGNKNERLVNLATSRGLQFWDLRRYKDKVCLKILARDFKALHPLVRMASCKVKIEHKVGLPFLIFKGRRRKGLFVGALMFFIALYFFSSFVWFVDIVGVERLSQEEVLVIANDFGIRPGILKRSLDFRRLEDQFVLAHEGIAWAGISLKGTLLQIEIVESILQPEIIKDPADLVARKDGLVEEILVLSGEPEVKPGENVLRGQVLIRGELKPGRADFFAEGQEGVPVLEVRARGSVKAIVRYESVTEVAREQTLKWPTGAEHRGFYLHRPGKQIFLWGKRESPFPNFTRREVKTFWEWRNMRFPVELLTVEYIELELKKQFFSRQEAIVAAKGEAFGKVFAKVPHEGEILRYDVEEIDTCSLDRVAIRVVVETMEEITELRLRQPRMR